MKYLDDVLVIIGCVMILVGVWLVWPVGVWFVGGGMCVGWGVVVGMAKGKTYPQPTYPGAGYSAPFPKGKGEEEDVR